MSLFFWCQPKIPDFSTIFYGNIYRKNVRLGIINIGVRKDGSKTSYYLSYLAKPGKELNKYSGTISHKNSNLAILFRREAKIKHKSYSNRKFGIIHSHNPYLSHPAALHNNKYVSMNCWPQSLYDLFPFYSPFIFCNLIQWQISLEHYSVQVQSIPYLIASSSCHYKTIHFAHANGRNKIKIDSLPSIVARFCLTL